MNYVIKSITSNSYYCGIEPVTSEKACELRYNVYWSQRKNDASLFNSSVTADKCVVFLHGIMNNEEELIVEEVKR